MEQYFLEVKNVTKRFVGTVALKNVNIELRHQEILAILGENGAGKSTLMRILSGSYPSGSYEGEVCIEGKPVVFNSSKDAVNAGVAMIYQEKNLELDLSVAENILLGRLPTNKLGLVNWKAAYQKAREGLARLGVTDIDVTVNARYLNASMQQLVCIARALVENPKILILDEPTSCLTEQETESLMEVVRELKRQGISCIYISHKLEEVFSLCDRIIILRDGERVSQWERGSYDSHAIIEDIVGRRLEVIYPKIEKEIGDEVLRVENMQVAHPYAYGKNIIEDVSFNLRRGEILGLTGLVGSGRSELLKAVFGATPKLAGKIYMNSKEIDIRSPTDAKEFGIGLLTEDRKVDGFIGCMNVRQNMTVAILRQISKYFFLKFSEERRRSGEMFRTLKIKAPNDRASILTLSGGNQQKAILAKWLLTDLKILFLDEPTRGVDVGTKAEIYRMIGELTAQGLSIVMISSELPELLGVCDRFVVLSKGRVKAELMREEADEKTILHHASNF